MITIKKDGITMNVDQTRYETLKRSGWKKVEVKNNKRGKK